MSDELRPERMLPVLCTSSRERSDRYPNLTAKTIPRQVLSRCEWGYNDTSLNVEYLPKAPKKRGQQSHFDCDGGEA